MKMKFQAKARFLLKTASIAMALALTAGHVGAQEQTTACAEKARLRKQLSALGARIGTLENSVVRDKAILDDQSAAQSGADALRILYAADLLAGGVVLVVAAPWALSSPPAIVATRMLGAASLGTGLAISWTDHFPVSFVEQALPLDLEQVEQSLASLKAAFAGSYRRINQRYTSASEQLAAKRSLLSKISDDVAEIELDMALTRATFELEQEELKQTRLASDWLKALLRQRVIACSIDQSTLGQLFYGNRTIEQLAASKRVQTSETLTVLPPSGVMPAK